MKPKCFLYGHYPVGNDNGYGVCSCGSHEYFDRYEWEYPGVLNYPRVLFYRFSEWLKNLLHPYFQKCSWCGKWDVIFGKRVGDHDNCAPF